MNGAFEKLFTLVTAFLAATSKAGSPPTREYMTLTIQPDGGGHAEDVTAIDWARAAVMHLPGKVPARALGGRAGAHRCRVPGRGVVDLDGVVRTFVVRFVTRMDARRMRGEAEDVNDRMAALEMGWQELLAFAGHDAVRVRLIAPLSNFASELGEAAVTASDSIVPIDPETIWPKHGGSLLHMDAMAMNEVGGWTHALSCGASAGPFTWPDGNRLRERANDLLVALRLHAPGVVDVPFHWFEVDPPVEAYAATIPDRWSVGGVFGSGNRARGGRRYDLDPTSVEGLRSVAENYLARPLSDQALELAVQRLGAAFARADRPYRLVDYWVALEAMFAADGGGELSYRASARIARFVGETMEERMTLRRQLRDSYSARSALVHGRPPTALSKRLQKQSLDTIADETEDVLRRAMRAWIAPGQDHSMEALDDAMMS